MADISAWSPVDESNTAAPPHGWPENMQPSGVNNSARAVMGGVRRWYDTVTAQITGINNNFANYLPLAGGTLTGSLHAPYLHSTGNIEAGGSISGTNIGASGGITATGSITAGGNIGASGGITATGSITAGGNIAATGIVHGLGGIQVNNAWLAQRAGDTVSLYNGGGTVGLYLKGSGGNIHAATTHYFEDAAATTIWATLNSTGFYAAAGIHTLSTTTGYNLGMHTDGTHNYVDIGTGTWWQHTPSSGGGQNVWVSSGFMFWFMRPYDGASWNWQCFNNMGAVGGVGSYFLVSDRRLKEAITPTTRGLAEILQLQPVEFERLTPPVPPDADTPTVYERPKELGFVAQDVLPILPEAIRVSGIQEPLGMQFDGGEPILAMTYDTIVATLVNAVKEMHSRLVALEAGKS